MKELRGHIDIFVDWTLPNTERIWEMRRNLQSEAATLLLALEEENPQKIESYLNNANQEIERNKILLEEFEKMTSVDKTLLNKLDACIAKQDQYRVQYHKYARQNTDIGNVQAYTVMEENLLPLLEEEAKLLRDITDAQNELTTARIERAVGMYISLLGLVVVGIICKSYHH